jgi:membrane associated rhomboid family serine protease
MLDHLLSRITPVVGRILALNAVVLLLQQTLVTSPAVTAWLRFDPAQAFTRPWTFLTYMAVHGGLFHLLANSLALAVFGPSVERRMGSTTFLLFYLYCGLGAAIFSLLVGAFLPIAPFVGASGAVLGVAMAFAINSPDAELMIFPIPVPIKARVMIMIIAGIDVLGALVGGNSGIAHTAHLGGLAFGWLFFRIQRFGRASDAPRFPPMRPRVPVVAGRDEEVEELSFDASTGSRGAAPRQAPPPPDPAVLEAAELDRLLDKIGATGMDSLTASERAFLDGVSRRRRGS